MKWSCLTKSRDCIAPHGNIQSAQRKKKLINVSNKYDVSRSVSEHKRNSHIYRQRKLRKYLNEKFDRTNIHM